MTHARRALDLRPGNAEALRVLARAYQLAGDAIRAGETFKLLREAQARAAAREAAELPVRQLRDLRRSRLGLARLHLRHGAWSMLQTLGATNRRLIPVLYGGAAVVATALAVGFLVLPLYVLWFVDPAAATASGGMP